MMPTSLATPPKWQDWVYLVIEYMTLSHLLHFQPDLTKILSQDKMGIYLTLY